MALSQDSQLSEGISLNLPDTDLAAKRFGARKHTESLATALVLLLVMAGLIAWGTRGMWTTTVRQGPSVTQSGARSSVAILGFKNLSGRPDTAWISTALSEMLAGELGAGEKLRTVPSEPVARAKADLSLTDTESLSADTLARLRTNLGSDFVVLGSYLDLGKASSRKARSSPPGSR